MASRYWVGGTATWDATAGSKWATTSGGAGGASVPTAADDVFLDGNSGAGTVTTTLSVSVCRSITCTGFAGILSLPSGANALSVGDASGGAFTLSATMTLTLTGTPGISFVSTSNNGGTGWGITTAGKTLPSLTFSGAGGKWVLQDALIGTGGTGTITVSAGAFHSNGLSVSVLAFVSSNTNTRTVDLTNSTVTLTATAAQTIWNFGTVTGLTFVSTGSTINFANTGTSQATVTAAASLSYNNVTFTGAANKTSSFSLAGTNTVVTGTLTLAANSADNPFMIISSLPGTARTLTAATLVATGRVDFMDITGAGAATWTTGASGATYFGDCLGNSGITFTTGAAQDWRGGGARLTGSVLRIPGVAGNFASTPDTAALSITGDITVLARVAPDDWTPAVTGALVTKSNTNQESFQLYLDTTGSIVFAISADGTAITQVASTAATGFTDGTAHWVLATWRQSDGRLQFFTADGSIANPAASDFTQLGTNQTIALASIFNSTSAVEVGTRTSGTGRLYVGNVYRAMIYNGVFSTAAFGGTLVFDPTFAGQTADVNTFVESSAQSATVTINTTGGNWSDTTKWSGRVPLPQDDVTIKRAFAVGQTISIDVPRIGKSIDFSGITGSILNLSSTTATTAFGSLTLSSNIVSPILASTCTLAGRSSHTLTSAGRTFGASAVFGGPGGTYSQQDALSAISTVTVNDGTLTTNDYSVTCSTFAAASGRTEVVNLGSSTLTLTQTGGATILSANASTTTLNASLATVVVSTAGTADRTISHRSTIGTITYTVANSPGGLVLSGGTSSTLTYGTVNIGSGRILKMGTPQTAHVITSAFNVNGAVNGYLRLPGVVGNYVSVPDSAALSITGDIDLRVRVALADWTPATSNVLLAKYNISGQRSFRFYVTTGGLLHLDLSTNGTSLDGVDSTVAPTITDGATLWVRVTWRRSDGRLQYFTADGSLASPVAADFTQLGTDRTASGPSAGGIFDGTDGVEVGTILDGTSLMATGNFYRAQIRNGLDGTVVFDANFTTKPFGANSFTESSANAATVTINGALAQVGDGRVSIESSTPGTAATISNTTAPVGRFVNSYLVIKDSTAVGGWEAQSSVNVSNNTGWVFPVEHSTFGGASNIRSGSNREVSVGYA